MSGQDFEIVQAFVSEREGEDLVPLMREIVEQFGPEFRTEEILAFWAEDPVWRNVDPEIEWTSQIAGLSRTATGASELLRWWAELIEVWDSYVYRTVELRDLGDWVLNVADIRARGRQGLDVEMRAFELAQVRDGKLAAYRAAMLSEEDALASAGLE